MRPGRMETRFWTVVEEDRGVYAEKRLTSAETDLRGIDVLSLQLDFNKVVQIHSVPTDDNEVEQFFNELK